LRGEGAFGQVCDWEGVCEGAGAEEDEVFDAGGCGDFGEDAGGGEEDAAGRAADLLFDLAGGEVEVDEDAGGPGEGGGVVGDDPVDAVFGADGGAVARLEAELDEGGGGVVGEGGDL
jgi:hypothetical protein